MVGRFVQQQNVGFLHQRTGQQHAALHSAGLRQKFHVTFQIEFGQRGFHPLFHLPAVVGFQLFLYLLQFGKGFFIAVGHVVEQVVVTLDIFANAAEARGHHVEDGAAGVLRHFLFQPRDLDARLHFHHAFVGLDLAADDFQQGGFAGAVAAHQTDALALVEAEGGA